MTTLQAQEAALYTDVWHTVNQYGEVSPGQRYVPLFLDMARVPPTRYALTVLDAGTGSGKGALALKAAGFEKVILCDHTNAGLVPEAQDLPFCCASLWDDLRQPLGYVPGGKVDYVYCSDVLEHIPPTFTMLTVRRLLDVARQGVFLSIALQPDVNGYWVGRPLHQTVQGFVEWRDQIASLGRLVECRDLLHTGLYYVEGK